MNDGARPRYPWASWWKRVLKGRLILITFVLVIPVSAQQPGVLGTHSQRAVLNFADLSRNSPQQPAAQRAARLRHAPMPAPEELPLSPEPPRAQRLTPSGTIAVATPLSPSPAASFLALGDDNTAIPPDTHGAVGPAHLMVVLNTQVAIQDRTGAYLTAPLSLQSFWEPFTTDAFDPRILYDHRDQRWIFTAVADPESSASSLLLAVSQTSDPTGAWSLFEIDADATNAVWADYPSVGYNKDWIVVSVNMFSVSNNAYIRTHLYVFKKADLYSNTAATHTLLSNVSNTMVPAVTYDASLATIYLLQVFSNQQGSLRLSTITGPVGSEALTVGSAFVAGDSWSTNPSGADFAPQLGSTQKIQNNDTRIQNLVYRNGSLWAAHTIFLPAGATPTRAAVQWWNLAPTGPLPTVLQSGRVDDPAGVLFFAFPSIAVNQNGDVLIGFSSFSAGQYATASYAFRAATDPAGTLRAVVNFKAGEAPYYKTFTETRNRWGDYSSTVVDPANDVDFWTIQEYAATPAESSDRWGTWWAKVGLTTPAPPARRRSQLTSE